MQLDNIELYNQLISKGVNYLYHANSLTTSLGFINNGGLLSRSEMERRGIAQTEQTSDNIDKYFNVWNDIFLDTIDLHGYRYSGYSRQNFYGPVLFILKTELFLEHSFENVWITNNNPTNWVEDSEEHDRYFNTVDDYIQNMNNSRQQKMITIRNINVEIPFNKYLYSIKLDDPSKNLPNTNVNTYDYALDKLVSTANISNLDVSIDIHECDNCFCTVNYDNMDEIDFEKYFL